MSFLTNWTVIDVNIWSLIFFHANTAAVEPVLAGVTLDHEAGDIVGQPADAIDGHRRHVQCCCCWRRRLRCSYLPHSLYRQQHSLLHSEPAAPARSSSRARSSTAGHRRRSLPLCKNKRQAPIHRRVQNTNPDNAKNVLGFPSRAMCNVTKSWRAGFQSFLYFLRGLFLFILLFFRSFLPCVVLSFFNGYYPMHCAAATAPSPPLVTAHTERNPDFAFCFRIFFPDSERVRNVVAFACTLSSCAGL